MKFSITLKELREQKNISQAKLANDLGVSVGCVGMWESTKQIPPANKLDQIANYFNVTVDYLLGRNTPATIDLPEGAAETKKASIAPIEEQMLEIFREIGNKHGKEAQIALIAVANKMI